MSSIQIKIRNCNNFDIALISLATNKLNIKFAPNGTGKSTIANAIRHAVKGEQALLDELMPFKLKKENPESKHPTVIGVESLQTVMCFNENYVNQFLFKKELLSNSFDILIRNDSYKHREQEINELTNAIRQLFIGNEELELLISALKEMAGAFKFSKSGLDKKSTGMKGLSEGNKLQHIPHGLESYAAFIQSTNSVSWIDWQTKGYEFTELSDNCPFCTSHATDKKDQIKKVGQEYDKNVVKNLISIISIIEKLGEYFSDEAKTKLSTITTLKEGIGKEHEAYLASVKKQIDNFTENLEKLKTLSAFQFTDDEKVADKLPTYKLNLDFFTELSSQKMKDAIAPINASIDKVVEKAGQLQGKINQQRSEVKRTIERHKKGINEFLQYAGYRYAVEIAGDGDQAQLKLLHIDNDEHIDGGNQHLSFGERNAFAIVLFMYECLAKTPSLIILDDPISSFDKNKKYAILEMLFRRKPDECLKGKTVLMLTHDVEPVIDTIRSLQDKFQNQTTAAFLKLSSGEIQDFTINRDDIQTFAQICKRTLTSNSHNIIKLIYLRRLYEILDDKGNAYQVLSNVFKKRTPPWDTREEKQPDGSYAEMAQEKFESGCAEIAASLTGFSYTNAVDSINNADDLKALYLASTNGYEKLQIFRLLGIDAGNSVIHKFINESYHIENEFICQLDPVKFDTIPAYVIAECDKLLAQISVSIPTAH